MKIAIISDTHDNVPRIDQMLEYVKKTGIKTMIHCGDVCAPSVLRYLGERFNGQIYLCLGNVDGDHDMMNKIANEKLKNIKIYEDFGEIEIDDKKIAFIHRPEQAKILAETKKYDHVFYGHNHKPWEETIGNTKLINPGTLAGLFNKSSFAILDTETDKLELIIN